MADILNDIHHYAVDIHLNNHIVTQCVCAVYATVLARKAGKKGLLEGWFYSFFLVSYVAVILNAVVNGNSVPAEAFQLNAWYLHSAAFFCIAFCPQDLAYQVATNEWVWPLVCAIAQLDIIRTVQALMAKSSSAALFPLFTGFLVMVGPSYVRGDAAAKRHELTMNFVAFVIPIVAFDLYVGARHANRGDLLWGLRYVQIVGQLLSTKFLPLTEDRFQAKLSDLLDSITGIIPAANDGKKKPAAKTTSARRTASPATPRSAKKTR